MVYIKSDIISTYIFEVSEYRIKDIKSNTLKTLIKENKIILTKWKAPL